MTFSTRLLQAITLAMLVHAAGQSANAASNASYNVTLNTGPLIAHPAGPFTLLFAFTDGSGLGDASGTVTIANVDFGGGNGLGNPALFGGASGNLETGVSMTDGTPLALFSESFSPGRFLRFTVTLTTNTDGEDPPDRMTFYVIDASGKPIPTLSPAADFLIGIDLNSDGMTAESFGTDTSRLPGDGNPIAITAPTMTPPDTVPPVTVALLSPQPNSAGWNNSNVTVTLNSTDNEPNGAGVKQITYSASGAQTIASTVVASASTSLTISAEGITTIAFFGADNAGNIEAAKRITVQVDKTPPAVACSASPNVLWPPNNELVPVNVSVNVTDSLSGPAGFNLVSMTSSEPDSGLGDIQGFVVGTPSTSGQLRAQRLGSGSGRTYTFVYSGTDRAGNATSCTTTVVVPHDQGH